ncbi:mannose-1-phosphate guanyltransferase [Plasmodium falciparum IGH-CR14]|uniref:Mannose-1-phosphate guanyltransferase n=1 Tax=Plasmodium falciparum IGH-CR14 TaxID=580059 RepID=A0A0L1IA95_PLAFA|nr:mannose-1-phosphate guanyltransferase [Plasmodium falciparum IGH-CR14]
MNALILVGGYGTRLRPLTLTTPKPLINFCNKPIIEHQILHLAKCGIKEIILAIAYKPTNITNFVKEMEKKYNVQIIFSVEDEPLGTGGPLKLAENYLNKYDDFFVEKEVEDPRAFGVVITEDKMITKFEEKPLVPKSSLINAGIYILNKQILNFIPQRNCSLEKEIFPKLASDNMLYFYQLNNFWADIGKPLDFLKGQSLYMENLEERKYEKHMLLDHLLIYYSLNENHTKNVVHKNLFVSFENIEELNKFNENEENSFIKDIFLHTKIEGNVLISSTTIIKQNCVLGDNVVLGEHVIIGEGCRIKNSCVMSQSTINSYSYIENSIIGSKSRVGNWSRIEGLCVLGESVILKPEIFVNNAFILPFKEVNNSIYDKGAIIM